MTDKELLELAAKAAGYQIELHPNRNMSKELLFVYAGRNWNPLTDYGDRYRLARSVKGNLYFSGLRGCFEIPSDSDEPPIIRYFTPGNDVEEAYAIVRAAAEIGAQMK